MQETVSAYAAFLRAFQRSELGGVAYLRRAAGYDQLGFYPAFVEGKMPHASFRWLPSDRSKFIFKSDNSVYDIVSEPITYLKRSGNTVKAFSLLYALSAPTNITKVQFERTNSFVRLLVEKFKRSSYC